MTPCRQTHAPPATRRKAVASKSAALTAEQKADLTNRHARKLPLAVAADRRLNDCDIRVLAVLVVSCRGGQSRICVGELANRAGVSESSAHNARRNLERLGYLIVAERRLGPRRNDTNTWTPAPAVLAGAKSCRVQGYSFNNNHTSPTTPATEKICRLQNDGADKPRGLRASPEPAETGSRKPSPADPPQRRPERTKPAATPRQLASKSARPVPAADGGKRQATPKARPRSATAPRPSARDIALTRALYPSFLRAIGEDGRAGTVDPETVGLADILREVDNYRRTRLPSWSERNWRNRLNHHGHKAHHAVIETALMAEIRDADRTDPETGLPIPEHRKDRLGNPAAYLGGILWKARGECRPDKTLERIAEARGIDVDALDNATEAAGSAERTATDGIRERSSPGNGSENAAADRRDGQGDSERDKNIAARNDQAGRASAIWAELRTRFAADPDAWAFGTARPVCLADGVLRLSAPRTAHDRIMARRNEIARIIAEFTATNVRIALRLG